jgi:pimeloyl-ACP methyl ester carboxylesterase
MRYLLLACTLSLLVGCAYQKALSDADSSLTLHDSARQRPVPVELYFPNQSQRCSSSHPCPVALLSPGYGVSNKDYTFIASALNRLGYLVVAIQNQLPSDPPLAKSGDLFKLRSPSWEEGAANIRFVRNSLSQSHRQFDWQRLVLVGHSNGGDISAWISRESPAWATTLITLDNRRVPLPRGLAPKTLSIRAADFPPDVDVLPSTEEVRASGSCIVKIPYARHNDMYDGGSSQLKHDIARLIESFLLDGSCASTEPSQ